jgi:hypothetical protein
MRSGQYCAAARKQKSRRSGLQQSKRLDGFERRAVSRERIGNGIR